MNKFNAFRQAKKNKRHFEPIGEKSVSIVEILHYANAPFRMTNIFLVSLKSFINPHHRVFFLCPPVFVVRVLLQACLTKHACTKIFYRKETDMSTWQHIVISCS
ncbi:MAG: hypothetical protein IJ780_07400, partial [Neisseriaceae bacterium]|nr:hypothetical protein [Neisseriaceae bacterium]